MTRSVVTLSMIEAVEKEIKAADKYLTREDLWELLRLDDSSLIQILGYLVRSHKIIIDRREIVWIFVDNPKLKKLVKKSVRME